MFLKKVILVFFIAFLSAPLSSPASADSSISTGEWPHQEVADILVLSRGCGNREIWSDALTIYDAISHSMVVNNYAKEESISEYRSRLKLYVGQNLKNLDPDSSVCRELNNKIYTFKVKLGIAEEYKPVFALACWNSSDHVSEGKTEDAFSHYIIEESNVDSAQKRILKLQQDGAYSSTPLNLSEDETSYIFNFRVNNGLEYSDRLDRASLEIIRSEDHRCNPLDPQTHLHPFGERYASRNEVRTLYCHEPLDLLGEKQDPTIGIMTVNWHYYCRSVDVSEISSIENSRIEESKPKI